MNSRQEEEFPWIEPEWLDWYLMTPAERWDATARLWETYLIPGGTLDPDPDPESPFFDEEEWRALSADGRPGLRVIWRSGI